MRIKRPLLVMRVDTLWPPSWYAGQNAFGEPTVTSNRAYAWRFFQVEEAREIAKTLQAEIGGVWSIVDDRIKM